MNITKNISARVLLLIIIGTCVAVQFGYAQMVASPDGPFISYGDGTVFDMRTEIMWAAQDNGSDINWFQARTFTENFRGGGYRDWRMPTAAELETLYDGRKLQNVSCGGEPVHLATDFIKLSCRYVWSSERQGGEFSFFFFDRGYSRFYPQSYNGLRVLPARLGVKR